MEEVFQNMVGMRIEGRYTLSGVLNKGSYGAVFSGDDEKTDRLCAIKCLFKKGLNEKQKEIQKQEIDMNKILGENRYICYLMGNSETEDHLFLIFEFCERGDLFDLCLTKNRKLTASQGLEIFQQILAGVTYSHSKGVFHRDLKPENILLTRTKPRLDDPKVNNKDVDTFVKIGDFGFATSDPFPHERGLGSPPYMAPELFLDGGNSLPTSPTISPTSSETKLSSSENLKSKYSAAKVDIWALGVIFFNILYGSNPWGKALNNDEKFQQYMNSGNKQFSDVEKMPLEILKIFSAIFVVDPNQRCSLQELSKMVDSLSPDILPLPSTLPPSPSPSANLAKNPSALAFAIEQQGSKIPSNTNGSSITPSPRGFSPTSTYIPPRSSLGSSSFHKSTPLPKSSGLSSSAPRSSGLSSSLSKTPSFKIPSSSFKTISPMKDSFTSSFASSWADDDEEMDYDNFPDETFGSCYSSNSFVDANYSNEEPTTDSSPVDSDEDKQKPDDNDQADNIFLFEEDWKALNISDEDKQKPEKHHTLSQQSSSKLNSNSNSNSRKIHSNSNANSNSYSNSNSRFNNKYSPSHGQNYKQTSSTPKNYSSKSSYPSHQSNYKKKSSDSDFEIVFQDD